MSEQDNNPNDPVEPADVPAAAAFDATPPPAPKPRWRDRTFRMRSIAAVAVAGVIIGAAGGAVTTALVSDDDRGDRGEHRIGQQMQPGMPMMPGGGRQRFGMPGDGSQDGELPEMPELPELPEMPVPPGSGSDDGSDDGSDEQSSLSQS